MGPSPLAVAGPPPPPPPQARRDGIDGNLRGDGLQNGGLLIVERGGQTVLLSHREEVPGDHVPNSKILRVLGIKGDSLEKPDGSESEQ